MTQISLKKEKRDILSVKDNRPMIIGSVLIKKNSKP